MQLMLGNFGLLVLSTPVVAVSPAVAAIPEGLAAVTIVLL